MSWKHATRILGEDRKEWRGGGGGLVEMVMGGGGNGGLETEGLEREGEQERERKQFIF